MGAGLRNAGATLRAFAPKIGINDPRPGLSTSRRGWVWRQKVVEKGKSGRWPAYCSDPLPRRVSCQRRQRAALRHATPAMITTHRGYRQGHAAAGKEA
jgi:hypothetical protein